MTNAADIFSLSATLAMRQKLFPKNNRFGFED